MPAGNVGGDVGADEAEDGGERDEAGVESGSSPSDPAARAAAVAVML